MFLLVGLGNPGSEYENHRHNVGFKAIDAIADKFRASSFTKKGKVQLAEAHAEGEKIILVKPQNFMNLSGPPVWPLLQFYKIPLENCIVFHDDLDLEPGKVRVKCGGGHGGHNGLRSLDQHVGNLYTRVRIGIGRPHEKSMVTGYVLNNFTGAEEEWLAPLLKEISNQISTLLAGDAALFMTKLASLSPSLSKDSKTSVQASLSSSIES